MNIYVIKNGPAIVSAEDEIELVSGEEKRLAKQMALCRCGHSFDKILCDGSHKNYSWE